MMTTYKPYDFMDHNEIPYTLKEYLISTYNVGANVPIITVAEIPLQDCNDFLNGLEEWSLSC
jgi:hypothetical protein